MILRNVQDSSDSEWKIFCPPQSFGHTGEIRAYKTNKPRHATDNFLLPTCNFKRLQHVKLPYKLLIKLLHCEQWETIEFSAGPHLLLPPGSRAKNQKIAYI